MMVTVVGVVLYGVALGFGRTRYEWVGITLMAAACAVSFSSIYVSITT